MDDLGVGYDVLKAVNPRLIYATGTGFGITGPDRDNLAMDFTIQAASGIMSVTGASRRSADEGGADAGGFHGRHPSLRCGRHRAVPARPHRRRPVGGGGDAGGGVSDARLQLRIPLRTGQLPPRAGNRQAGLSSAPYNAFPTKDGWVAIHVVTEAHWQNLLKAMGREDLADDPRFATNAARTANMEATEAVVTEWTTLAGQAGGRRRGEALPHSLRAGAQRGGGDERSAHARPRHAGADRSIRRWARSSCRTRRCGCTVRSVWPPCRARGWDSTMLKFIAAGWDCPRRRWRR